MRANVVTKDEDARSVEPDLCGHVGPRGTTCVEPAGHAGADLTSESHGDGSVLRWLVRAQVEPARLWSIACAVGTHDGCRAVLDEGGLLVVCPCSCHVEVVGRCGSCGVESGQLPCPSCEAVDRG